MHSQNLQETVSASVTVGMTQTWLIIPAQYSPPPFLHISSILILTESPVHIGKIISTIAAPTTSSLATAASIWPYWYYTHGFPQCSVSSFHFLSYLCKLSASLMLAWSPGAWWNAGAGAPEIVSHFTLSGISGQVSTTSGGFGTGNFS